MNENYLHRKFLSMVNHVPSSSDRIIYSFFLFWVAIFFMLRVGMVSAGCPNECSKYGFCNKNNTCTCAYTHTGSDCSLRTCAKGVAWTDYALKQK